MYSGSTGYMYSSSKVIVRRSSFAHNRMVPIERAQEEGKTTAATMRRSLRGGVPVVPRGTHTRTCDHVFIRLRSCRVEGALGRA